MLPQKQVQATKIIPSENLSVQSLLEKEGFGFTLYSGILKFLLICFSTRIRRLHYLSGGDVNIPDREEFYLFLTCMMNPPWN